MARADKDRTIAVVAYAGVALLDLVATKKVFDRLAKASGYRSVSVGERTEPIGSDTPLAIIPEKRFEDVADPFALVVPGGGVNALKAMGNGRLLDYLSFASHGAEVVASVSTGAFLLSAAGLLEGRRATTHPAYGGLLKKLGVDYVHGDWVEDGRFLTAAGASGGIDMALYLVARLKGEREAKSVQTVIEYDPHPPFGGLEQDGGSGGDGVAAILADHGTELERALADKPDLYDKMFG